MSRDQVKRTAVKAFLRLTLRHPEVHEPIIEDYIQSVHLLTKTAYLLAKYVLIGEVERDRRDIFNPLKVEFFVECLLTANSPNKPLSTSRGTEGTRNYRTTISHLSKTSKEAILPLDLYLPFHMHSRHVCIKYVQCGGLLM
jgi:hypothetical protein